MIDAQKVYELMTTLISLSEEQGTKAFLVCQMVCEEMSDQLKKSEYAEEHSVIYACATISLYRYLLSEGLSCEDYESLKAGDITIKRSLSSQLENAENLKDNALLSATRFLEDMSFAFKVV